jgi:16S rRNA G966 N2-methylase RsmD
MSAFTKNDFLKESHVSEIDGLQNFCSLSPWLNRDDLMVEVFTAVLGKQGKTVTAKHFKEAVESINQVIQLAQTIADALGKQTLYNDDDTAYEWDARIKFIAELQKTNARTPQAVKTVEHKVRKMVSDNLKAHQERMAAKAKRAEEEERKSKPIEVQRGQWWKLGNHRLYCGDTSQPEFYNGVSGTVFAFADPPYNAEVDTWDKDFVWNHDWLQDRAKVVAVTPGIASIKDFMQRSTMRYLWSISCWIDNGMTRGAVGFGNWIYIAMHSAEDSLYANAQDVIRVSIDNGEREANNFKGRKPSALLERMVEMYSKQGETIIDPFLGYGTTLYVAERMGRNCVGGEIDEGRCKDIIERYEAFTGIKGELLNG